MAKRFSPSDQHDVNPQLQRQESRARQHVDGPDVGRRKHLRADVEMNVKPW